MRLDGTAGSPSLPATIGMSARLLIRETSPFAMKKRAKAIAGGTRGVRSAQVHTQCQPKLCATVTTMAAELAAR